MSEHESSDNNSLVSGSHTCIWMAIQCFHHFLVVKKHTGRSIHTSQFINVGITERVIWHTQWLTHVFLTQFVDFVPPSALNVYECFSYTKELNNGKALEYIAHVGMAFGFTMCFNFIPTLFHTLNIFCRKSWRVWALQTHECSLQPLHLVLVLLICLVHCLVNLWSIGNLNKLTPSLWEFLYPATAQCFPMFRCIDTIATSLKSTKLKYGHCSYTLSFYKHFSYTNIILWIIQKIFANLKYIKLQIQDKKEGKKFSLKLWSKRYPGAQLCLWLHRIRLQGQIHVNSGNYIQTSALRIPFIQ